MRVKTSPLFEIARVQIEALTAGLQKVSAQLELTKLRRKRLRTASKGCSSCYHSLKTPAVHIILSLPGGDERRQNPAA
jgi:hypothetical protein